MNQFSVPMKPSTMGREAYSVGLELRKVWRQHAFLKKMVTFQHMGFGTNVYWVFMAKYEEDARTFNCVPTHFATILNAVNLEMTERPALFNPPVKAEQWEMMKVQCRLQGKE